MADLKAKSIKELGLMYHGKKTIRMSYEPKKPMSKAAIREFAQKQSDKLNFFFFKLRTSLFSNRQVKPETRQQELKPRGCTRQKNKSGKQSSERKTRRRQKERAGKKEKQKKREKDQSQGHCR
jgi:hypothetical protein